MPTATLRRLTLAVSLCAAASLAHAENWPGADWAEGAKPDGPAVAALEAYAFPTRDDVSRKGIRTDALVGDSGRQDHL